MTGIVTRDLSVTLQSTPTPVLPNGAARGTTFYRLFNASSTVTVWLSRAALASQNVGVNAAGSYPLQPLQYELFTTPQAIPLNALWGVAATGTAPLTVEIG